MKKKILVMLFVAAFLVCAFVLGVFAEETSLPTLNISYVNLSLEDSVYINYKVSFEGITEENAANIKLLVWEGAASGVDYTEATIETDGAVTLSVADTQTIGDVVHKCFQYKEVAAKEMGKTLYARAYYEVDANTIVYSDTLRYSVVQYLDSQYKKAEAENTSSTPTEYMNLLSSIRAYGAAAQAYFATKGEETGVSVSNELYAITLTDGTFADGFSTGKFLAGETVTVSVPEGYTFHGWETDGTFTEGTESSITVTEDATYTPVYGTTGLAIENGTVTGYTGTATEVVIPNGVTSIGANAFAGCTGLTSITIPDSVTSIGTYAFQACTKLASIRIPASVVSIDGDLFEGCSALESIDVATGNTEYKSVDGVLYNKDGTTLICYPAGKTAESFDIPDSVTEIGASAFYYCTSLTSVMIPEGVTSIGNYAFAYGGLTSVTIPESVTSIGAQAFAGCANLTSVEIPTSVTSIGDYTFFACYSLTSVTIPDSVTEIGKSAFADCTGLTSVTIPDGVTSIGNNAFNGCTALTTINYAGTAEKWANIGYTAPDGVTVNYNYTGETSTKG